MELEDSSMFHLELQSSNDEEMPYRMLEYLQMIARQFKGREIRQKVLYVEHSAMTMNDSLNVGGLRLRYSYEIMDVRDIDCEHLLRAIRQSV